MEMSEGKYESGTKSGYCRYLHEDKCEIGFFHKDKPKGKYCVYGEDGSYIKPEGLYEGEKIVKLHISNYSARILRT